MTYDPYQTHSALGGYPGLTTPFQSPQFQSPHMPLNPQATAYPPIAGINPYLAQMLAARAAFPQLLAASPWASGLNNPLFASAMLQNPLLAATLENPLVNPIYAQSPFGAQPSPFNPYIGQTAPQIGQQPYPFNPYAGQTPPQIGQIAPQFGQIGSPYGQLGSMLPPQSWVGQPGLYGSHPLGQVHPLLSQLIGRGFPGAGMFPTGF